MRWRHNGASAHGSSGLQLSGEEECAHSEVEVSTKESADSEPSNQLWDDANHIVDTPSEFLPLPRRRWGAAAPSSSTKGKDCLECLEEESERRNPYWPLQVEQGIDQVGPADLDLFPEQGHVSLAALGVGTSVRAELRGFDADVLRPEAIFPQGGAAQQAQDHSMGSRHGPTSRHATSSSSPSKTSTAAPSESLAGNLRNLRRARRRAEARGGDIGPEAGIATSRQGCIVLIREDCRLHDNPALFAAAQEHQWLVPLYVHDDDDPSPWPVRGAGLWWRHKSLQYFDCSLRKLGSQICYRKGSYIEQVVDVLLETGAASLYFNRQLEPWHITRDRELHRVVGESFGLTVRSFKAMVTAFEPWDVKRKKEERAPLEDPLPTVTGKVGMPPDGWPHSIELDDLCYGKTGGRRIPSGFQQYNLKRQHIIEAGIANASQDDWAFEMAQFWQVGEHAAMKRLEEWLLDAAWGCYYPPGLNPRDEVGGRFRADKRWTAIISPYLRFGDLSPRYVHRRCCQVLPFELRRLFMKRVFWRDKAYAQLYRWPDSHSKSIREKYECEIWSGTRLQLRRWQRGETGFPLVDAAMRQLWKVGWMCNHLRHVTAQFLIEHLDLNWKDGFAWYDYTLVDTDVAINAMMWQMGGHSGIGAWNFVMHPVFAGKKVDPDGAYVRRWMPELAHLPVEYIHCPWEAPAGTRIAANVLINGVYWQRVLEDLIEARKNHQRNVIAVRKLFPQLLKKDGADIVPLANGSTLTLEVRDDIRENDEDKITLMMTADDPRSALRRSLGSTKGVHGGLIYDETKRFEAMYDSIMGS